MIGMMQVKKIKAEARMASTVLRAHQAAGVFKAAKIFCSLSDVYTLRCTDNKHI
jgi:hypothetical protein